MIISDQNNLTRWYWRISEDQFQKRNSVLTVGFISHHEKWPELHSISTSVLIATYRSIYCGVLGLDCLVRHYNRMISPSLTLDTFPVVDGSLIVENYIA